MNGGFSLPAGRHRSGGRRGIFRTPPGAGGRVLATAAFPVGGLMSEKTFPEVVREMEALSEAVKTVSCALQDPFMQLAFLPLPVIPFLKLTDRGLVDVEKFDFIEV